MASDAVVFVFGFGSMLSAAVVVGLAARLCRRAPSEAVLPTCWRGRGASEVLPTSDEDDEMAEVPPRRTTSNSSNSSNSSRVRLGDALAGVRSAGVSGLTKVYFRESDWCSRVRKPVVIELPLEGIQSVQELCTVLRHAHRMVVAGRGQPPDKGPDAIAMTIEYQSPAGEMVILAANSDVSVLPSLGSLYVTTNSAPTALLTSAGSHLAAMPLHQAGAAPPRPNPQADEGGRLVDVSLAGCCGVQSTYGGLRISSNTCHAERSDTHKERRAELNKLRAAKFRHYLTL